jgi:hypothetical protein
MTHGTPAPSEVRSAAYRPTVNHDLQRLDEPAAQTPPAPALPAVAQTIAEQALTMTPAQAKALHTRWSQTTVADVAAGLRAAQQSSQQPGLQEELHREVRQHVLAAKLAHEAQQPDQFAELWAPVWDVLCLAVPAAAVALSNAEHITGAQLLTLAGPWVELYGIPRHP